MTSHGRDARWFLVAGLVALAAYYQLPSATAQDAAGVVVGFASVIAIVVGVRRNGRAAAGTWSVIAAGVGCFVVGDAFWMAYADFLQEPPSPSPADLLYLLGYPLLGVGLWRSGRTGDRSPLTHFDAAVFVAAGLVPVLQFLVLPLIQADDGADPVGMVVSIAYPVGDLLLLAVLVRVLLNSVGRIVPLRMLAVGLGAMLVADVLYARMEMTTGYTTGQWFDTLWLIAYLCAGAAALHPDMAAVSEPAPVASDRPHRLRLVFLALCAIVTPVLAVGERSTDATGRWVLTTAAMVVAVLVVARLGMTVRVLDARTRALSEAIVARDGLTERLRHASQHDSLTGLPNRDAFARAVRAAVEAGGSHVVVFCDLDEFKAVNDDHGHPTGDEVLKVVAQRFLSVMRPDDVVARLGGDEFGMLWRDVPTTQDAADFAQRLLDVLRAPIAIGDLTVRIGASIGMTLANGATREYADLLADADVAVYGAKRSGRGQAVFFEPAMREQVLGPARLARRLRDAIDAGALAVVFQPVVNTATGEMTAVEALVRWEDDGVAMAPNDFLPIAADHGLIDAVDEFVLNAALALFANWSGAPGRLHVNASPQLLANPRVVQIVRAALDKANVPAHRLTLEMTEYAFDGNTEVIATHCHALRELGISLALDDFGTGYSSLSYLQRFPFDALKLDRTLTALVSGGSCPPILRAVIRLGHSLGLRVIAEGVESDEQMHALRSIGCDEVQGYLVAAPAPISVFSLLPDQIALDLTLFPQH